MLHVQLSNSTYDIPVLPFGMLLSMSLSPPTPNESDTYSAPSFYLHAFTSSHLKSRNSIKFDNLLTISPCAMIGASEHCPIVYISIAVLFSLFFCMSRRPSMHYQLCAGLVSSGCPFPEDFNLSVYQTCTLFSRASWHALAD